MTTDDPFLQKVTGSAGNIIMGGALSSLGYSAVQNGATMSLDGAMSALFVHLFNDEWRDKAIEKAKSESNVIDNMSSEQLHKWGKEQL